MSFIGRGRELKLIRKELETSRPSFIIIYGRRRVGKSRLLREVASQRQEIYFQATKVSSALNLEQFKEEVAKATDSNVMLLSLATWEGVFHYLASMAVERPNLTVTIDEFPYILDNEPALPSIIQKFWDSGAAEKGNLKLILCGSAIAQMEGLLAERNPLYGRKTMSLDIKPMPLRDVAGFFPDYSAEDIIKAYAVFGGIPYYLRLCDPRLDLRENIVALLLTETGTLIDEPNTLLQNELREPAFYSSILAAIADGCHAKSEIANRLGAKSDSLGPYLVKLEALDLISNTKSLDADEKGRHRRYTISDGLIAFWHRFVRPNLTAVSSGFGQQVYDQIVASQLSRYLGGAFESIALEYARLHIQEMLESPAQTVGQIWGHADFDIDVAGKLLDGRFFYGECKWRSTPVDLSVIDTLKAQSEKTAYGKDSTDKQFLVFSRTGFSREVLQLAKQDPTLHLLTPENLTHAPK